MGGPSGGCVPAEYLDLEIDYDSVQEVGAIMGSGGLIVMDQDTCVVDVARFFIDFVQKESCGKCVPCRIGTKRMFDILTRITAGEGEAKDIAKLDELGKMVGRASLCGLGQTAPNPVLSTIRYFREEYEAHINDKSCPAGVCKELVTYRIVGEKCTGCGACRRNCPTEAISGEKKQVHVIDQSKCFKCGVCKDKCKFEAVEIS
jgi:ferredoxin